jgi:hypothetical protein
MEFTALILLSHKPELGFVMIKKQFYQTSPMTKFSNSKLDNMPTFYVSLQKYKFLTSIENTFHSLEELEAFINA